MPWSHRFGIRMGGQARPAPVREILHDPVSVRLRGAPIGRPAGPLRLHRAVEGGALMTRSGFRHPLEPGNPDNPRARFAERSRRVTVNAARLANRRRAAPRWTKPAVKAALFTVPLLLLAGLAGWGWTSGTVPNALTRASQAVLAHTARSGLAVGAVYVEGRQHTSRQDLVAALGVDVGDPILAFDPHAARERLESIPWVARATVERRLPDQILIRLVERTPMALWQVNQSLRLVDGDGVVLTGEGLERWHDLPLIVGPEAPARGRELLALLARQPDIGGRVQAATLVSGRRWDLRLDNGVDVKLPERDIEAALSQLAEAQVSHGILDRDVVAVDLRLADRLVVQTSAQAAEARRRPPEKARGI